MEGASRLFDGCAHRAASAAVASEARGRRREAAAHRVVAGVCGGECNGTLLCYGQTGSGKTHTVGVAGEGLLPRALQQLTWISLPP